MSKLFDGWIINAWKKEDADQQVIKIQNKIILILSIISFGLLIGWMHEPSNLTIHIPPDIQNGATIKAGSIPPALVYSFTYQVWQELNFWPKDGELDYKKSIQDHWSYITPQFKQTLLDEYEDLKKSGELQRVRYMQGLSGAAYDAAFVKKIDNMSWEVDLKMHLIEYKNNEVVKEIDVLFPLKVTRVTISPTYNPYGFSIAGFVSEPKRLNASSLSGGGE